MRRQAKAALAILGLLSGGCSSDGLSPREDSTSSLSAAVYQQNAQLPASTQPGASAAQGFAVTNVQMLSFPTHVGVVQIGEVAPPESMLSAFRQHGELFSAVEPMPGNIDQSSGSCTDEKKAPLADGAVVAMRKTAAEMGLNYILLYGGTVDCTRTPTPLEVFNLTIVGAFVVPSDQVSANGKAAGSLIEVTTGRIVLNLSADAKGGAFLPSIEASEVNESMRNGVRDELIRKMTDQTIQRLSSSLHGK